MSVLAAGFLLSQCGGGTQRYLGEPEGGTAGVNEIAAGAAGKMSSGLAGGFGAQAGKADPDERAGASNGGSDTAGDQPGGAAGTTGDSGGVGGTSGVPDGGGSPGTAGSAGHGSTTNPNGTVCTAANQCASGRCVDGVCCNVACDDTCQACSNTLTGAADGVCSTVKKGTDPHDTCATSTASTCGQTGLCGSNGACALYDSTTVCKAASCASGTAKAVQTCDGVGTCKPAATVSCTPYSCGASACMSTCTANMQCAPGQVCIGGACKAPSPLLGGCDELTDCQAGTCIEGVCALTVLSIEVTGAEVSGGGMYYYIDGWFKTDSSGKSPVLLQPYSVSPSELFHNAQDNVSQFSPPIPPNTYLVLQGGNQNSNPLTRTFQFNLSDGSAVTKSVSASSSTSILYAAGAGDIFTMFQWTGATVNVFSKTY